MTIQGSLKYSTLISLCLLNFHNCPHSTYSILIHLLVCPSVSPRALNFLNGKDFFSHIFVSFLHPLPAKVSTVVHEMSIRGMMIELSIK